MTVCELIAILSQIKSDRDDEVFISQFNLGPVPIKSVSKVLEIAKETDKPVTVVLSS